MNINWKLRLQNKATLTTLCVAVVTAVYSILAALGITPSIAQEEVHNLIWAVIAVLSAFGIVVDPTTKGVSDSSQAMGYEQPRDDQAEYEEWMNSLGGTDE